MKIGLITDTHVGIVRRVSSSDESFEVLEEALQIFIDQDVDFILHAGDFFDEARPTNSIIAQATDILRKKLENFPKKITFSNKYSALLEPTTINSSFLPFFLIHGNHDPPTQNGMKSVNEIISSSGIINLFQTSIPFVDLIKNNQKVILSPVIISKENITIKLYGLPYLSSEKFQKLLKDRELEFLDSNEGCKILLIHQDGWAHGRSDFIDPKEGLMQLCKDKIDIVFWGHEHQFVKNIQKNGSLTYIQLGSTIATQFKNDHEVGDRFIGILNVNSYGTITDLETIRLTKNVPFILKKIPPPIKKKDDLRLIVQELVDNEKKPFLKIWISEEGNDIRRLDVNGIMAEFNDRVANPNEFIQIRKIVSNAKKKDGTEIFVEQDQVEVSSVIFSKTLEETLKGNLCIMKSFQLKDLLNEFLKNQAEKKDFEAALEHYVEEITTTVKEKVASFGGDEKSLQRNLVDEMYEAGDFDSIKIDLSQTRSNTPTPTKKQTQKATQKKESPTKKVTKRKKKGDDDDE